MENFACSGDGSHPSSGFPLFLSDSTDVTDYYGVY